MAEYQGEYPDQTMDFDPRETIDKVIKLVYGNSDGWVIWSSYLKMVIEPPNNEKPIWFMYSARQATQEILAGYFVFMLLDRAESGSKIDE